MEEPDDSSGLLPPEVALLAAKRQNSGHEKKRATNALPRVFLVMCAGTWAITGAVLVSAAYSQIADETSFHINQYVALDGPYEITKNDFRYRSSSAALLPAVEEVVRRSLTTTVAMTLNHHYSDYANRSWQVWTLQSSAYRELLVHDFIYPHALTCTSSFVANVGIVPTPVDKLPDPLRLWQEAAQHIFGGRTACRDTGQQR